MAKSFDQMKSELLEILDCVICHDSVDDARICVACSQHFCNKCISHWLTTDSTCPKCRHAMHYSQLVKGNIVNQIQESINKLLIAANSFFCDKHRDEALFCLRCEVTVCCWRSEEHKKHMERIVSLAEAFGHYKQVLKPCVSWIKGRKEEVDRVLNQVQENGRRLNEELEQTEEKLEALLDAEENPETLMAMMEAKRTIKELRLRHSDKTELIQVDRLSEITLEPTILIFHMDNWNQTLKERIFNQDASYGTKWKCTVTKDANFYRSLTVDKTVKDDGRSLFVHLCLVQGNPGAYSVLFENTMEKLHRFELHEWVNIGVFKPVANVDNNTQVLTVELRQSYKDRVLQMQDYIARLEKDNQKPSDFLSSSGIGNKQESGFGQLQKPTPSMLAKTTNTAENKSPFGVAKSVENVWGKANTNVFGKPVTACTAPSFSFGTKPAEANNFLGFGDPKSQSTRNPFTGATTSTAIRPKAVTATHAFFSAQKQITSLLERKLTLNEGSLLYPSVNEVTTSIGDANGTAIVRYQHTESWEYDANCRTYNVKQQSITCMKEYANKSLEELRLEDYAANRHGPQTGARGELFKAAPVATSGFGKPFH